MTAPSMWVTGRQQFPEPEVALTRREIWKLAVSRFHDECIRAGQRFEIVETDGKLEGAWLCTPGES